MSSLLIPAITYPTGISFCTVNDTIGVIQFSDVLDWQGQIQEERHFALRPSIILSIILLKKRLVGF